MRRDVSHVLHVREIDVKSSRRFAKLDELGRQATEPGTAGATCSRAPLAVPHRSVPSGASSSAILGSPIMANDGVV